MDKAQAFGALLKKLPPLEEGFKNLLEARCELLVLSRNEPLAKFRPAHTKMYFVIQGSLVRNIITSKGKVKTVLFHTEKFLDFLKCYDAPYFNTKATYEIVANEKSVVLAVDFEFMIQNVLNAPELTRFYFNKTEEMLLVLNLFRNFQLGLTSEEYLKWLHSHYGFLFQRFPAQNIASFMGITNVWLSKLNAKMVL